MTKLRELCGFLQSYCNNMKNGGYATPKKTKKNQKKPKKTKPIEDFGGGVVFFGFFWFFMVFFGFLWFLLVFCGFYDFLKNEKI